MSRSLICHTLLTLTYLITAVCGQARNCGVDTPVHINASGTHTSYKPFDFPFGPLEEDSETWTWTLDTVSYDMHGANKTAGIAEQRLWLSTQLQINFTDPEFGFLGCGMILHGLRHGMVEKGQKDKGDCTTILDAGCLRALDNSTSLTSQTLSPSAAHGDALDICSRLAFLGNDGAYGLPGECSNAFVDDAWIQTFVFASPQTDDICSAEPGASTQFDPLAVWGAGQYSQSDMMTYDNLTTSVTPLMVTLFTNRTVNSTQASSNFSGQQLTCLRPSKIEAGSASPSIIPNAGVSRSSPGVIWSISLATMVTFCSFLLI